MFNIKRFVVCILALIVTVFGGSIYLNEIFSGHVFQSHVASTALFCCSAILIALLVVFEVILLHDAVKRK